MHRCGLGEGETLRDEWRTKGVLRLEWRNMNGKMDAKEGARKKQREIDRERPRGYHALADSFMFFSFMQMANG